MHVRPGLLRFGKRLRRSLGGFGVLDLLTLASALVLTSAVAAAAPAFRPTETADAVLHAENTSWSRQLHDALRLPQWLDIAVDQRTRFEFFDDSPRPDESQTQTQIPQRSRLRVGIDAPGGIRVLGEFQDARTWNDRPRDFTTFEVNHFDVLQLFLSASAENLFDHGLRVDAHVGRLTLDVASRRLVARNEFRNTTNAFDGAHFQIGDDARSWRVRAFYTLPVEIQEGDVLDDKVSARRRFWGLVFEDLRLPWIQLDAYYLGLDDLSGNRDLQTFGFRAYRRPALAQLDYELELIGQLGEIGAKDQSAFSAHTDLGFTFALPWSPRLSTQFDFATGTSDPNGDDSHTFDPLFAARRGGLMPTGIFGPFRSANILTPGVRLGLVPARDLRIDVKIRHWRLAEARDVFSGTGLQDPTGDAGRDLGTDIELRVRWEATAWLGFDAGYDHWWKGRYLDEVPNAERSGDSDYFYLQSQVRF